MNGKKHPVSEQRHGFRYFSTHPYPLCFIFNVQKYFFFPVRTNHVLKLS